LFNPSARFPKPQSDRLAMTMTWNRGGEVGERIELPHLTGWCHGQDTRHGGFSGLTAITERDLSP
jgi:hypothetical protein